jgi:predicted ester cyclase
MIPSIASSARHPALRFTEEAAMPTGDENTQLVRRLLDRVRDYRNWDDATLKEFFTPRYRRHLTPTTPPLTATEQRERAGRLRAAFPDANFTLEDVFGGQDRVAYRLTFRGTHEGHFLGVPPTHKSVTVSFIALVRIEDGKLAEEWGGLDQVDLLRQLGAELTVKA